MVAARKAQGRADAVTSPVNMPANTPLDAQSAILALLESRDAGKSICPSEAARVLAGPTGDWRARMEDIHNGVDALNASGEITLSWKGVVKDQRRGAYRIARR